MVDLVDPEEIEGIVGAKRHPTEHLGRADSEAEQVFILHSKACKDSGIDLRDCPFSLALSRGIMEVWDRWETRQDVPVLLGITDDEWLIPRRRIGAVLR